MIAAFELSLAEGLHFEKRLFHATFATVSRGVHLRAVEGGLIWLSFNMMMFFLLTGRPQRRHDSLCGEERGQFQGQVEQVCSHLQVLSSSARN